MVVINALIDLGMFYGFIFLAYVIGRAHESELQKRKGER